MAHENDVSKKIAPDDKQENILEETVSVQNTEEKKNASILSLLPKGVGISRKLAFLLAIVSILIIFFVVLLIFNYRQSKAPTTPSALLTNPNNKTADTEIDALNSRQSSGVLVSTKNTAPLKTQSQDTSEAMFNPPSLNTMSANSASNANNAVDMQYYQQQMQAARSSISVANNFHGPDSLPVMAPSENANAQVSSNNNLPAASANGQNNTYQNQNMQGEKTAFLQTTQQANNPFYINSMLVAPISKYEVKAGTILPATLKTGIDSDLPGTITAQLSANIYDTVTGNYLLIPQGTKILGVYDSQVAYGQSRVLIAWSRLIFPNGDSYDLQGQPGVDLAGMAGLSDQVNNHYFRIFGSALIFSLFGAAGQLSQPQQSTNGVMTNQQIIYGAIGQQMSQTGAQLVEKNMNIQPTITIRPGANFNILLTRDMVLPGPYVFTQS